MADETDFEKLVARALAVPGRTHMRPVIEKELLHYDILFCLDREGLLNSLTFQGGTMLRLCHGSPRFSEDLGFAGGREFSAQQLAAMGDCLERYIGRRYQLDVVVKQPKALRYEREREGLTVDKWQIAVVTAPQQKHLPRQRIKIEVANIPAYSREAQPLKRNYDFLPDGYDDILIMAETLDEIMTDKLVSLVNTRRYVRHRDIWDLRWLKQQGATFHPEWLNHKLNDYRVSEFPEKLQSMWQSLPEIIQGDAFRAEMTRFIPVDVQERTLLREGFSDVLLREVRQLLSDALAGFAA